MTTNATPSFDFEFDHTDAETAAFAGRCGCSKCDRYRTRIDAQLDRAAARSTEIQATVAAMPATARQPIPVVREIAPAPAVRADFCSCPLATRPNVPRGTACTACGKTRAQRTAPTTPAAQPTAETTREAAALGVNVNLRAPAGSETRTPREQVIVEIEQRLGAGRAPTRQDLQKWDTLLRSTAVTTSGNRDGYLSHRDVVAGAHENAAGKFFGFAGLGQLTRAQLLQCIEAAGLPSDVAPAPKSAHAQAGRVVGALNAAGFIVRAARLPKARKGAPEATAPRTYKARWTVGAGNHAANVGDAFGRTVLTVTLLDGDSKSTTGQLVIEGEESLAIRVRADFEALCAGDVYSSSDVSAWLTSTMFYSRWRAAHVGGNYYVRNRYCAEAETLCGELAKLWGRRWMLPAIPMSTGAELLQGMVDGFTREAEAVLKTYREELAAAREEARANGESDRDVLLGTKRAKTLLGQVRELAERAVGFGAMFGDERMRELRARLAVAGDEIAESIDDITQRFSLIFDELLRDAKAAGWESL